MGARTTKALPRAASGDRVAYRSLQYGSSWQLGVTCRGRTGHGMFLSARRTELGS